MLCQCSVLFVVRFEIDIIEVTEQTRSREVAMTRRVDHRSMDDADLMRCIQKDDTRAFDEFVRRYIPRMWRSCFRILRNNELAEDAVQDALMSVHKGAKRFEFKSSVGTWVFRITRNCALMVWRAQRSRIAAGHVSIDSHESLLLHITCPLPQPDDKLFAKETGQKIADALNALPEEFRTVFILRYVFGMPTEEIAKRVGVSHGATKSRLHRALLRMQTRLRNVR